VTDLSDGELRARLVQRGVPEPIADAVVAERDAVAPEEWVELLGDAPC
jgi:hypothetical protein